MHHHNCAPGLIKIKVSFLEKGSNNVYFSLIEPKGVSIVAKICLFQVTLLAVAGLQTGCPSLFRDLFSGIHSKLGGQLRTDADFHLARRKVGITGLWAIVC